MAALQEAGKALELCNVHYRSENGWQTRHLAHKEGDGPRVIATKLVRSTFS